MDQPPSDQPLQEPSDGADSGFIPEDELAEVFSKASKLADELAQQLDANDAVPATDMPASSPDVVSEPPELDAQLDDLDSLMSSVDRELIGSPAMPNEPPSDIPAASSAESTPASAIPEFMNEFTLPKGRDDAITEPSMEATLDASLASSQTQSERARQVNPAVQSGSKPGIVASGFTEPVGVKNVQPPSEVTVQPTPRSEPDRKSRSLLERFAKVFGLATSAAHRLTPMLLPAAEKVVGVLEKTDRPFARLKPPFRRAIGWLAIATLGTSVLVFVWSLV